jgi:hypothetical protein
MSIVDPTFENFKDHFPNVEIKRTDGTLVNEETVCLITVHQPDKKQLDWIVTTWQELPEAFEGGFTRVRFNNPFCLYGTPGL